MRLPGPLCGLLCILAAAASAQSPVPAASQVSASSEKAPSLAQALGHLLADPHAARAHWGIAVTTLEGIPVYALDDGKLFRPASSAKLFTTAAALALLGQDTRFHTSIYGNLDARTGAVQGDLVLSGGGDPSFGTDDTLSPGTLNPKPASADLEDLVHQLLAKGLRSVSGRVVGDDRLFSLEPPPQGWAAEDLVWGYGALPSALSIGDNQLSLTVQAGKTPVPPSSAGPPAARVQLTQLIPWVQLANNVATESPELPGTADTLEVEPIAGHPHALAVLGNISPGVSPVTEHIALPDPAAYAAEAMQALLARRSVRIASHSTAQHSIAAAPRPFLASLHVPVDCETTPAGAQDCEADCTAAPPPPGQLLAQHTSAPLTADVRFTLKTSANLHAEVLLHQLAAQANCDGVSTLDGARRLRAWLSRIGVAEDEVTLFDGSGLSTKDLVTPHAEAALLAYAVTQPWYAAWRAALPVAGVDGTLAHRFVGSPVQGKLLAKTGTLGESRALAGYLECSSGRELIVSILVDDHEPGSGADRDVMDRIVTTIAALN